MNAIPKFIEYTGSFPDVYEYHFISNINYYGLLKYWYSSYQRHAITKDQLEFKIISLMGALSSNRVIFIHIPKTAGTSVVTTIMDHTDNCSFRFGSIEFFDMDFVLGQVNKCRKDKPCFISGHVWLRHLSSFIKSTSSDIYVTVYRDVLDLHSSILNYISNKLNTHNDRITDLLASSSGKEIANNFQLGLSGEIDLQSANNFDEDLLFHHTVFQRSCGNYEKNSLIEVFKSRYYQCVYGKIYKNYLLLGECFNDFDFLSDINIKFFQMDGIPKMFMICGFDVKPYEILTINRTAEKIILPADLLCYKNIIDPEELNLCEYLQSRSVS